MDSCTHGLFSFLANGAADYISDTLPALMTTSRGVVIALVALVPVTTVLLLACRNRSRETLGERRGVYHRE